MSLFMGKYRRTRITTSQPKKPGYYLAFYYKEDMTPNKLYWNGKHWTVSHTSNARPRFGDNAYGYEQEYWAPIPKDEQINR